MNTITRFPEDDDRNFVEIFDGTITFTLSALQRWNIGGYQKFRTNFQIVRSRHQSATNSLRGDISKTCQKILFAKCVQCSEKKSMIGSDKILQGEGRKKLFESRGKFPLKLIKNKQPM